MKNIIVGLFVAISLLFIACQNNEVKQEATTATKTDRATELAIKRGIEKAKKTLKKEFLDVFEKKLDLNNYNYSLKMAIRNYEQEEHIWLDNLRYDNSNTLMGFIANKPKHLTHVKSGDKIKIEYDDVVDWMYLKDDVLHGGYTIKAMAENMNAEQKKAFEERLGFKISK